MASLTTISIFPFHQGLEKTRNFNYRYGYNSSKFHFSGDFVLKTSKLDRDIRPVGFWRTSRMGNAVDHRSIKADLRQHLSIYGISEVSQNKFSVANLEYTLNHLSKWLLMTLLGAVLICKHDNEALWAASGTIVNAAISTMLKKIVNQNRPVSTSRSDPGMPSSHAQTIFFTSIFAIISLFQYRGTDAFTISISVLTLAFGSYLSWLRVSQQFHTISQVVVGAVLGTVVSILWFWSWVAFVHKAFVSILWVRVIVDAGAVAFWVGFIMYISRNLIFPEDRKM